MTEQKLYKEESNARIMDYIQKIVKEKFLISYTDGEFIIRCRRVGADSCSAAIFSQNKLYEVILRNQLVALVYARKNNKGFTEESYIVFEETIKKMKEKGRVIKI